MALNITTIRVLEAAYGGDSDQWIGNKVKVYVDPNVSFGGKDRQTTLGRAGQPAFIPFALHFQTDQQEEDRHQPVGDPFVERQLAQARHGRAKPQME